MSFFPFRFFFCGGPIVFTGVLFSVVSFDSGGPVADVYVQYFAQEMSVHVMSISLPGTLNT